MSKSQEITELADQAAELVANLKSLKERSGLYAQAKEDLAATRNELGKLITETSYLAGLSHQVLQKLDQIGMASLLEQLTSVQTSQSRLQTEFQERHAAVEAQLERVEATLKTMRLLTVCVLVGLVVVLVVVLKSR